MEQISMERIPVTKVMEYYEMPTAEMFVRLMAYFDYELYKKQGQLDDKDLNARLMAQLIFNRFEVADRAGKGSQWRFECEFRKNKELKKKIKELKSE